MGAQGSEERLPTSALPTSDPTFCIFPVIIKHTLKTPSFSPTEDRWVPWRRAPRRGRDDAVLPDPGRTQPASPCPPCRDSARKAC